MSRRKKILKNVKIEQIAAEGRGLGRHEGKVVFVDYAVPGDVVDVLPQKDKKDYAQGRIAVLNTASPLRQEPFCEHFWHCGGCRWQHVSYRDQLRFKQSMVEEAYRRIGKLSGVRILDILACDDSTGYRNKMEYTFSDQGWFTAEEIRSGVELDRRVLGFHVSGQYQRVVHVKDCALESDLGNRIRNEVYSYAIGAGLSFHNRESKKGFLRNLIIRTTTAGESMVLMIFGHDEAEAIGAMLDHISTVFPELTSVNYVVNTKVNEAIYDLDVVNWKGRDHIVEELKGVRYRIGPKSFFQTNSRQAEHLYDLIVDYAAAGKDDLIYDLYTGTGSIALYMADKCRSVVGVETVPEAIEDARLNAALNDNHNCTFIAGSSEKILSDEFLGSHGRPDIVITDPPRAGMHGDVINFLLRAEPRRIVYVSCNPVTQARDIMLLSEKYDCVEARPVDMFPQTYHVECVAVLERK